MRRMRNNWMEAAAIAALLLCCSGIAAAQGTPSGQGTQSQPPAPATDKTKTPDAPALTLDAPAPVNAEEDAAYKVFQDVPATDLNKRIDVGEAFVQKYPQSRYKPIIYANLTMAYLQSGQVQKMLEVGDKAVELTPNDVTTLAILGQTIPRALTATTADPAKQLAKAETYSKRAIELTPTLPKPANLTDEAFDRAKNQTLAAAHSGLGLVYVRRGKYAEAIPELELSVKLDSAPDPVNYYLLGTANEKASHFDDSIAAFTKCAAMQSSLQTTCKNGAEEAKKLSSTQLSAPK
jgi:tetratricopeptide (TPR) repeat protein